MQRVGLHTVQREIERSGLLSTYEATHDDGRPVRLRVFTAGVTPDPEALQRFEEDATLAARAGAEGVAAMVGWSGRDPIHVSTLAAPGAATLAALRGASEGERLEAALTTGLALEVARALAAAHEVGLVHAGLSDGSIVVDREGHAQVTDFALSRLLTSMSAAYSQLMQGSIEHLAPEQLNAPDQVGAATDVFALGLVLYRTLTAKDPFPASSALGVSIRISMGNADPVDGHGVPLPPALSALVMRMLSGATDARPTMREVVSELSAVVDRTGAWRDALRRSVRALNGDEEASRASMPSPPRTSLPAPASLPPASPSLPPASPSLPPAASPAPSAFTSAPYAPSPAPYAPAAYAPAAPGYAPAAPAYAPAASPYGPAASASSPAWAAAPSLPTPPSGGSSSAWAGAPPSAHPGVAYNATEDERTDLTFDPAAWTESTMALGGPDDDARPTIRQDSPLVDEEELPSFLRDGYEPTQTFGATDDDAQPVPKTMVMMDPRAASMSPAPVVTALAPLPAPVAPRAAASHELTSGGESAGGAGWLLWVAVGFGALVVLGGTVVLAIALTS